MAGVKKKLEGVDIVLRNLNKEIQGIDNRTRSGLGAAALVVKADALKETPVDTGNLRQSAYTEVFDSPEGYSAVIGYTASYAPYVHEIDKNYNVGNWQFLRNSLMQNETRVLRIIQNSARIRS